MPRQLLSDKTQLTALFGELADELAAHDATVDVVMVGGAWMLRHSQRASTFDVDSGRRFETDLRGVVARVAARHGIRRDWLNDAAAAFWPSGASRRPPPLVPDDRRPPGTMVGPGNAADASSRGSLGARAVPATQRRARPLDVVPLGGVRCPRQLQR